MQDLNRLLYFDDGQQQDASDLPELKSQLSLTALGNAIRYLKLVDETSNLGHFQVKQLNMDRFSDLDLSLSLSLSTRTHLSRILFQKFRLDSCIWMLQLSML